MFVVGLFSGTVILKQVGAPLMGASLLPGLAVLAAGLVAQRTAPAPAGLEAVG